MYEKIFHLSPGMLVSVQEVTQSDTLAHHPHLRSATHPTRHLRHLTPLSLAIPLSPLQRPHPPALGGPFPLLLLLKMALVPERVNRA